MLLAFVLGSILFSRGTCEITSGWSFDGIGIILGTEVGEIRSVIPESPAAKSRILPGDRIVLVNGKPVKGKTQKALLDMMRGASGTSISLALERNGLKSPLHLILRREHMEFPTLAHQLPVAMKRFQEMGLTLVSYVSQNPRYLKLDSNSTESLPYQDSEVAKTGVSTDTLVIMQFDSSGTIRERLRNPIVNLKEHTVTAFLDHWQDYAAVFGSTRGVHVQPAQPDAEVYWSDQLCYAPDPATGAHVTAYALQAWSESEGMPRKALLLRCLGLFESKQDFADAALRDLDESISLDPSRPNAYFSRGLVRYAAGFGDGALADYSEAIRLDPAHATALNERGILFDERGEPERAVNDYSRALLLRNGLPCRACTLANMGSALAAMGEPDRAIDAYSEALKIDPAHVTALIGRFNLLAAAGHFDAASSDVESAVRAFDTDPEVYVSRGFLHLLRGEYDAARTDADKAIALDKRYAAAYDLQGMIGFELGESWAIKHLTYAVKRSPRAAGFLLDLAIAQLRAGNVEEAKKYWSRALVTAPKLARGPEQAAKMGYLLPPQEVLWFRKLLTKFSPESSR